MGKNTSRRGPRRRGQRRNPKGEEKSQENVNHPDCPFCGKPVRDISSAIADQQSGLPCHFDCVLKRIADEEKLQADEKVCYLGNGSFGIIQPRASSGPVKFSIKKRIQFESKEAAYEWRREISSRISNLTQ